MDNWVQVPDGIKMNIDDNGKMSYSTEDGKNVIIKDSQFYVEENGQLSLFNPGDVAELDKELTEMEKHLGVPLNKDELRNKTREQLLDFIEAHTNSEEYTQEEIDAMVESMASAVMLPEVVAKKEEIDNELGLSAEDLKSLYSYLSGKGDKPLFLDRYLAGSEGKLKDFQHIMTLLRLSSIPQLAAMHAQIQSKLYSPENLLHMDVKDLATASANLSREMSDILNGAVKSIELMNSMGSIDSKYRKIMDKLLVVPEDVLVQIEHLLENR